jgi:hypothetical protein
MHNYTEQIPKMHTSLVNALALQVARPNYGCARERDQRTSRPEERMTSGQTAKAERHSQ